MNLEHMEPHERIIFPLDVSFNIHASAGKVEAIKKIAAEIEEALKSKEE